MEITTQLPSLDFKTVFHHLNSLQEADFKKFVADDLRKLSPNTLRNWLNGTSQPSNAEKKLITEYIQQNIKADITQSDLFPEKK